MTLRAALLLLPLAWSAPALAATGASEEAPGVVPAPEPADPAAELAAARGALGAAAAALTAAEATPEDIAPRADAVAGYETALGAVRAAVAAARGRAQALAAALAVRRDETARLLGALAATGRELPPADGLHPAGPIAAARAAAAMARIAPALEAEAKTLAGEIAALNAAQALEAEGEAVLAGADATLRAAQTALAVAIAAAAPDPAAASNSPMLTMMARDSESLTALAAALARTEGAPPPPAAAEQEPLQWPVAGDVLRRFNEPDAAGVRRPGVVVVAPALALVRAPAAAVVRYAGPFLEYGYVVVLEPDRDTMVVLAGIAQLQVQTGETVDRGALVGLLGGRPLDVEETVMPDAGTGAGMSETLYIEIRHGQGPVDPEPLFDGNG